MSAQRFQQRAQQVRGERRVLYQLVAPLVVSGARTQPQHTGPDTVSKHRRDKPPFPSLRVAGGGAAGLRRVVRQPAERGLGRRGEHHDLLSQRAAGDPVRPLDASQCGVEFTLGQGLLSHRRERGLRIQLVGQFGLAGQQSRGGHQRKQLRLLIPAGGRDELLDLPGGGWQSLGQHGQIWMRLAHLAIVAPVSGTGSSGAATRIGTPRPSVELDWKDSTGVDEQAAARGSALHHRRPGRCPVAKRPPVGVPALSGRARILITAGVVALVVLIAGSRLVDTYVDWLWFGEVGFRSVFSTVLITRLAQFLVVGLVVGGLLALNIAIAYRTRPVFVPVVGPDDPVARYRTAIVARLRLVGIGLPVLIGLLAGLSALGDWQTVQMFLHGTSFGVSDPHFNKDIGFYAFDLPFYQRLLAWAFVAVVLSFVAALITHYLFGGLRLAGRGGQLSSPARVQLAVLAGTFVLLKAVGYYLDRYELLFSRRNSLFTGASYTDLNAVLPAKVILMCIAVICAVAFFVGAVLRNLQLPAIATALLVLSSILVGAAWPAMLEQFVVRPNANEREAPSIERNIVATREAYGITNRQVEYIQYSGRSEASPAVVRADTTTIPNIRLLDPNVLSQTFTQLQQRENFYGFPEKLDVDRYTVAGRKRDYIVAVRELESASLAANQRNWINQHLTFTHGNGFVAAPANETVSSALRDPSSGESGYPRFTVSDTSRQGDIPVQQPRIYFGELIDDYAIVGGNPGAPVREFDGRPENYTYQGKGGVSIGSWTSRLLFAAYYGERNILFNQAIGSESKIIYNQHPRNRVQKVAPWLTVDGDPYPAVVNGRIQWILDGYTTVANYPYAQRTVLGRATADSLAGVTRLPDEEISYIRNSVKATVDAYDGTVTLYAVDESDPILRTWMDVFPGTVRPASEISNELREHFRYPEDLFKVQREMLARYHVNNPSVFFTNDDFWNVPTDPTQNQQGVDQPPYYVLAGPPSGSGPAEFQLTSALVSLRRPFLASYISVSSDPKDYGKIRVLELPSESQTQGPEQVQNRFVSSAEVSRELNLLRQSETDVRYGNLLTLPVGGGLLYVEPVYIERANRQAAFPQLNRVLVAYGERIGYAATLREALNQVFDVGAGEITAVPEQGTPPPATAPGVSGALNPQLRQAVTDVSNALRNLRQAQVAGDFAAQGKALAELDLATKRFDAAAATAGGGG
jgi:uncharacterized membrane protein (UPF0182 family)